MDSEPQVKLGSTTPPHPLNLIPNGTSWVSCKEDVCSKNQALLEIMVSQYHNETKQLSYKL